MADINLNITIRGINVDIAVPAFLRRHPMPQIDDLTWQEGDPLPIPQVDKYASTRLLFEEWVNNVVLREVNRGIDKLKEDAGQPHLTSL